MMDEMKFSNKHFQLRIDEIADGMATVQVTMHQPFEVRINKDNYFDEVNAIVKELKELSNDYFIEHLIEGALEKSEKKSLKAIGAEQFAEVV